MKRLFLVIGLVSASAVLSAQENGYVTGSFETNNHLYVNDAVNEFQADDDRIGSNNYLKVDYYKGNLSAGLQLESYLPAQIGFPEELSRYALSNMYVNWKDDAFQVTAGTFYDQFGSGLLFRSWEDRLLGLNNAIMGARFAYNWDDKVAFKAIWGMPRLGMEFTDTQVRGADLSVSLSNIIGLDDVLLSVEGSVLNKYTKIGIEAEEAGGKPNSLGFSGRLNFDWNGFFAKGEYVDLGKKLVVLETKRGNAQLVDAVAPNLSVRENLELICGIHGFSREKTQARLRTLSAQLDLDSVLHRRAGKLSGGFQRRVSIAMALISEPKILFLDEPTLGLDVLARHDLWEVIRSLKGRITIILTTHYMEEAEALSDRIGIMKSGRLLAVGTAEELTRRAGAADFEAAFVSIVKEGRI